MGSPFRAQDCALLEQLANLRLERIPVFKGAGIRIMMSCSAFVLGLVGAAELYNPVKKLDQLDNAFMDSKVVRTVRVNLNGGNYYIAKMEEIGDEER